MVLIKISNSNNIDKYFDNKFTIVLDQKENRSKFF